jgi:hypothetical protein
MTADELARDIRSSIMAMTIRALARRPMTIEQLALAVYQGREPQDAVQCLRVTIGRVRPEIEARGWTIVSPRQHKRGRLYYLAPLAERGAA